MCIRFIVSLACVLIALAFSVETNATEYLLVRCTTEPTGPDGTVKECVSKRFIRARKGHYFRALSGKIKKVKTTPGGFCYFQWREWTRVGKGKKEPRKLVVRATARSPHDRIGGIGQTVCRASAETFAYE